MAEKKDDPFPKSQEKKQKVEKRVAPIDTLTLLGLPLVLQSEVGQHLFVTDLALLKGASKGGQQMMEATLKKLERLYVTRMEWRHLPMDAKLLLDALELSKTYCRFLNFEDSSE